MAVIGTTKLPHRVSRNRSGEVAGNRFSPVRNLCEQNNHRYRFLSWAFLFIAILWAVAAQAKITPPFSRPAVRPLISDTYSNDLNRNKIDDELESRISTTTARLKSAVTSKDIEEAKTILAGSVEVELVFNDQVTQQQIDDFLGRGGEITYVYKAVSYGWNGRIALKDVNAIPSLMGATLVLVQEAKPVVLHLDVATRTGRVRPVWAPGFAGNPAGFDGSDTITIATLDTGIDANHPDLAGRQVYWHDFSADGNSSPVDIVQHGSHVAGIAFGTGAAGGSETGTLYYTDSEDLTGVSSGSFYLFVIGLPATSLTYSSTAQWTGGGSTTLHQAYHTKGSSGGWSYLPNSATGVSPLTITNTITGSTSSEYSTALLSNGAMQQFVITNSVTNYPGVGDGFNKFRGVAPGCNWAAAKVFQNDGTGYDTSISSAIDDLVSTRAANNIKVMNMSLGVSGRGSDPSLRAKVNTAVNNGIVVVVSAGNDGPTGQIGDPGGAAMALTVAASDDNDQLTDYSSQGFTNPGSTSGQEEDYKPDIMAPGGSANYYTAILSVDSGSGDGSSFADQQSNDYTSMQGTSMASPFAAGAAALVIDALQQQGITWDFYSNQHASYVKMVLCATASETNASREGNSSNPTLQRASAGPSGFPAGKDLYEGYGMINPDAAVEAVTLTYTLGSSASDTLGPGTYDRRVWARKVGLKQGVAFEPILAVPSGGDFDLYLYSATPSAYGTPVILASSTQAGNDVNESFNYDPVSDVNALLVVKRVSGSGTFSLTSQSPVDVDVIGSWVTGTTHAKESGTNRALVFVAHAESNSSSTSLTGVSYGGQTMTKIIDRIAGSGSSRAYVAAFILNDAGITAATSTTFTSTWTSQPSSITYTSVFLQDVNQTTLFGATANNGVTSSRSISTSSLATGNGDMVIEDASSSATGTYTVTAGWTKDVDLGVSGYDGMDGHKSATGANETPSVSQSSGNHALIGFVVKTIGVASSVSRTLTVTSSAGGTVTQPGIGDFNYTDGNVAALIASANANYHFVNWTGSAVIAGKVADPNSPATTVTMNGNYTVQANFAIDQKSLTTSTTTGGTITTPGIGTYSYDYGANASIIASATTGYHFVNWTGSAVTAGKVADANSAGTTVTMDANYTVQANFGITQFIIHASAGDNGSISPNGDITKDYGSSQQFTALPNTGYEVNEWTVDGNSVQTGGTTYTLSNITAAHTVHVTFKILTYTVTASAGDNGSISPNGDITKDYGSSQQFTALPNAGYEVNEWTVDGNSVQTGGTTYTLSNITAAHTVHVTFKILTYTVTASAGANGSISPNGDIMKDYGSSQQFTALPNTGYEVNEWTVDGNSVQTGSTTYMLSDITATHTVTVTFRQITLSISGYAVELDGNTPVADVLISAGDTNTLTDANGYYELLVEYGWSGVVTPQKEGYVFEPNSLPYADVNNDYNDMNYTTTLTTFKIAGYVLESDLVTPISDVNVSAENGGGAWTSRYGGGATIADTNGYYEVIVDYNWSGVVVPTKYAYAFEPNGRYYADVNQDYVAGQDYTGILLTFRIIGHIQNECNVPIEGVAVDADNGGGSAVTDANGFYEVWVGYGWSGEVTPGRKHYTFEPNWISYVDVLADLADQNYVALNIYDLDCDGAIGLGDLAVLAENWLVAGPGILGDFNADEFVDFIDFAYFGAVWQDK